jgi:hypothetical protein
MAGRGTRVGKGAKVGTGATWIGLKLALLSSSCFVEKPPWSREVKVGTMVGSVKGWIVGQGVAVGGIIAVVGVAEADGDRNELSVEEAWFSKCAIKSQPPIKPIILKAAVINRAVGVNLAGFRLGLDTFVVILINFLLSLVAVWLKTIQQWKQSFGINNFRVYSIN